MSSREKILGAVGAGKPTFEPAPGITPDFGAGDNADLSSLFMKYVEAVGAKVLVVDSLDAVRADLAEARATGKYIVNTVPAIGRVNDEVIDIMQAGSLESVYRAFLEASLGVAENGAVWLYEHQLKNRLLPFICQHLVICLNTSAIVRNMHEAYKQIAIAREGYGVFIAGPSKTADIEQSLVIGAHGARSLLVYLVNDRRDELP